MNGKRQKIKTMAQLGYRQKNMCLDCEILYANV